MCGAGQISLRLTLFKLCEWNGLGDETCGQDDIPNSPTTTPPALVLSLMQVLGHMVTLHFLLCLTASTLSP